MFIALTTVVIPRYFGRRHLGAISGLNMAIMVFASAIGPVLFSCIHSITGSYHVVVFGCLIFLFTNLIAGLKAHNPQRKIK